MSNDLSPIVGIKAGRGNLGGSTSEALMAERAVMQGRRPILADGDARNPGLSAFTSLYSRFGIARPATEEATTLREWFADAFGLAAEEQRSLLVDIGGGDRTLEVWAKEEGIIPLAESVGLSVTGLFMCGPQPGDLAYIKRLWEANLFRPKRAILIFNEWTVPAGSDPDRAFAKVVESQVLAEMSGCEIEFLRIPKLTILPTVVESGLSFEEAMEGKPRPNGTPFDVLRRAQIRRWLETIEQNIAEQNLQGWLP